MNTKSNTNNGNIIGFEDKVKRKNCEIVKMMNEMNIIYQLEGCIIYGSLISWLTKI